MINKKEMLNIAVASALAAYAFYYYNESDYKINENNDVGDTENFAMTKFEDTDKLENVEKTIKRDFMESKKRGVFIYNLKTQDSLHNPSAWRQQNIYLPSNNGMTRTVNEASMDVSKANIIAALETARNLLKPNTHSRWTINKQISSIQFPQSIGEGGLDLPNADILQKNYPFFSVKTVGMSDNDKTITKRNDENLKITSTNGVSTIDTSTQTWTRKPLDLVSTLNPFNPGGEMVMKSIELNQINKITLRPDAFQAL